MNRAERRNRREKKIAQRVSLMKAHGMQGGLLYERHRNKIQQSAGYMSKGNVTHYVALFHHKRKDYDKEINKYGILCTGEECSMLQEDGIH
jgi:hypothetical protein